MFSDKSRINVSYFEEGGGHKMMGIKLGFNENKVIMLLDLKLLLFSSEISSASLFIFLCFTF